MTTISENWVRENRRESLGNYDRTANYLQTTNGAKTCLELAQKISQMFASDLCLGQYISTLSLMLVPDAFREMWQSLSAVEGENLARKSIGAVRASSDALSMSGSALSLFSSNPAIETASSIGESTCDGADLYLSGSDYLEASGLEELATGDVKEVFAHSKNYYFLRVCRAVVSIAATVFSLFLIAFSPQWGLAALTLSTIATMLSIVRDTHKESGPYPIIAFDHPVLV